VITEWFLNWVTSILSWLLDTFLPDWDVPAELTNPGGMVEAILTNAAGLGAWIDFPAIALLAAVPFGVWVIGILWKSARTAFSHFPGIGGSG
jgi:hypothetical protein